MTTERLIELLDDDHNGGEFLKFERVISRRSNRPDLHAFLLLDSLVPGDRDIIGSAEHDEFWLSIELDELAAVITEDQVIELSRCGIRESEDALCMFA